MELNASMHAVILQCPDHLEARSIADMRQPGISVAAEIAL